MNLIAHKLGKSDKLDCLTCLRADGSTTETMMPRQGTLPHDLIHYVIEGGLGLRHGFTGMVARGANAGFVMAATHDPVGKDVDTEAIQVEAIVEALQTQLWSGQFKQDDFLEGVRTACLAHERSTFAFSDPDAGQRLFDAVLALNAEWMAVPYHGTLTLHFAF